MLPLNHQYLQWHSFYDYRVDMYSDHVWQSPSNLPRDKRPKQLSSRRLVAAWAHWCMWSVPPSGESSCIPTGTHRCILLLVIPATRLDRSSRCRKTHVGKHAEGGIRYCRYIAVERERSESVRLKPWTWLSNGHKRNIIWIRTSKKLAVFTEGRNAYISHE